MGYGDGSNQWRLWDIQKELIRDSAYVIFDENIQFIKPPTPQLNEASQVQEAIPDFPGEVILQNQPTEPANTPQEANTTTGAKEGSNETINDSANTGNEPTRTESITASSFSAGPTITPELAEQPPTRKSSRVRNNLNYKDLYSGKGSAPSVRRAAIESTKAPPTNWKAALNGPDGKH